MKSLVEWHKEKMNDMANRFELSAYQVTWIAFVKGAALGCVIGMMI
jgi:hypothetical protein